MARLALFDLDNTLLAGDSDHAWGEFVADLGIVDAADYRRQNDAFYDDYCRGELDAKAYHRFVLTPLSGRPQAELAAWHAQFMRERVLPMVLPKAQALLAEHRAAGDILVIITATNDFITGQIAEYLGVDHLIATRAAKSADGSYTGDINGEPCYREGKISHLNAWLAEAGHSMAGSVFYSDSHNDIPLLTAATKAVAVDPDDKLRAHAQANGWDVISLRD